MEMKTRYSRTGYYDLFVSHRTYGQRTKGTRKITLKRDMDRGVKYLNEQAYHKLCGGTRASLSFFEYVSTLIDVKNVYRATLKQSKRHWVTLRLYTTDGYVINFKGCNGGYMGEGTRGTHDILKACGFNERQCKKAFTDEEFTVIKRKNL